MTMLMEGLTVLIYVLSSISTDWFIEINMIPKQAQTCFVYILGIMIGMPFMIRWSNKIPASNKFSKVLKKQACYFACV